MAHLTTYLAILAAAAYLTPTLVGWIRRVPHLGSIAVINIALGWTLIGWVIALAMAARSAPPPATPRQQGPPGT